MSRRRERGAAPTPPTPPTPPSSLAEALAAAADGLRYLSEGDAPLVPFALPLADGDVHDGDVHDGDEPLDDERVRSLVGASPDAAIEAWTLDGFFAGHIEALDRADRTGRALRPRFVALRELLAGRTRGARAWRIREDESGAEVRCWVGGRATDERDGGRPAFIGVATTAWES